MAVPFLNHITLNQNEARDFGMHLAETGDITTPVAGQLIFDNGTGQDIMKYYDGSQWISVVDTVRTVSVDISGNGTVDNTLEASETLVLKKGTNITLAEASGIITISSTDTNTQYTAGVGLTLDGTEFDVNVVDSETTQSPQNITNNTNRLYQVETRDTGHLVVNVPWVNTDTNTDTLQSISTPTSNADSDFYISFVENNSGAQVGYVDGGLRYNPTSDTLVVQNITISGTSTTVNTETINLADNFITLNSNEAGTPSENAGIEVERGTSDNVKLTWNEAADDWEFTAYNHASTPALITYKIPRTYSEAVGGSASIAVNHNLGTRNVIVQLFDTSSYETVYADVVRTNTNTVTLTFANAPAAGDITVLISTAGA